MMHGGKNIKKGFYIFNSDIFLFFSIYDKNKHSCFIYNVQNGFWRNLKHVR